MNYWIMKSEPNVFAIQHLAQKPNKTDHWEGVRNYQARNYIRDQMKKGDLAFFYHSNCEVPAIVGIIEIVNNAYPDFSALDQNSPYFDPKASPQNPRWFMVDIKLKEIFTNVVSLTAMKQETLLKDMQLLKKGNRLSILPINHQSWDHILSMAKYNKS